MVGFGGLDNILSTESELGKKHRVQVESESAALIIWNPYQWYSAWMTLRSTTRVTPFSFSITMLSLNLCPCLEQVYLQSQENFLS